MAPSAPAAMSMAKNARLRLLRWGMPKEILEVSLQELQRLALEQQSEVARRLEAGEQLDQEVLEVMPIGADFFTFSITLLLNRKGLVKSRSEAKRLIAQRAIELVHADGSKIVVYDDRVALCVGDVVQVGKRGFLKIVDGDN